MEYSAYLVEMFFLLSGFLYAYVYERIINGLKFDEFFLGRLIRVAPAVILSSIYMYICNLLVYLWRGSVWSMGNLYLFTLFSECNFVGVSSLGMTEFLNTPVWYISILLMCYVVAFILTKISSKHGCKFVYVLPMMFCIMMTKTGSTFVGWNRGIYRGCWHFLWE